MRWRVAWGQLALVTALAGLALAYLLDARSVSLSVNNLLLVQPTALFVLALWVVIALGTVRRALPEEGPSRRDWLGFARVVAMVAAFGLFIASLERIGYDIAIALFVAVGLFIGGERRPLWLVLFPVAFAALVVLGFRALVPYPFPTTLF
jgi:amino acid transporter